MLCIIIIVLFLGSSQLTCAGDNSSFSDVGAVSMKNKENATSTTDKGENVYTSSTTNIISTTPSLFNSIATSDVPLTTLSNVSVNPHSTNVTKVENLLVKLQNSSLESEQPHDMSKKANIVVTEGGNNVTTLDESGTNSQDVQKNSRETIVAEGGVHESAGERIFPNATAVSDIDPHSTIIEGISSMNEGKIIARKGVVLDDNEEHKTNETGKNIPITSDHSSNVRKPKPVVTDDKNELLGDKLQKMDYVIPIVCTVFSVPLLIVLAIYLYKKGSDLWERRHYNRMDFLIEGMYNE